MNQTRRMLLVLLTAIILLGAAGCSQETPEITATPNVITVAITPAARYTGPAVSTCAAMVGEGSFEITEVYAAQANADLLIRLGEPTPASPFAAQIATEGLVVILHPDNPAGSLTLEQVQQLFSGQIQNWAELGGEDASVQVWSLLPADETRAAFIQGVLDNGLIATTASLAPTPELMVSTVAGSPNAIGFLPKSWSTSDLTAILPGVDLPVLVVADGEPQGAARQLVACLQSEVGQELLSAFFPN